MSISNFFSYLFNFGKSEQSPKTISQKNDEIQFKSLSRKQLTSLLLDTDSKYEALKVDRKYHQLLAKEKNEAKEDFQSQLTRQILNELYIATSGNLQETLEETGCVVGFMAGLINDLINDLKESLYELPASHNLVQKYHIVKPTNTLPQKNLIDIPPINRTEDEESVDVCFDFDDTFEAFDEPKLMTKKKNIDPKSLDSKFSSLSRNQLISCIVANKLQCKSVEIEIENLRNLANYHEINREDLFKQMLRLIDKINSLSQEGDFEKGNLRNLPPSTHDILQCIADQINLLVYDLQQALKELTTEHRLVKKYKCYQ